MIYQVLEKPVLAAGWTPASAGATTESGNGIFSQALRRRSLSNPIVMEARVRRRSPPYLALRRSVTGLGWIWPDTRRSQYETGPAHLGGLPTFAKLVANG